MERVASVRHSLPLGASVNTATTEGEGLTRKDKELIAVAASLAAGCIPCTMHHARAVHEAGASEQEARWAAAIGLAIKRESLAVMAGLAAEHFGTPQAFQAASDHDGDGYVPTLGPLVGGGGSRCCPLCPGARAPHRSGPDGKAVGGRYQARARHRPDRSRDGRSQSRRGGESGDRLANE